MRPYFTRLTTIASTDLDMQRRGRTTILIACGLIAACVLIMPYALILAEAQRAIVSLLTGMAIYGISIWITRRGAVVAGASIIILTPTVLIIGNIIRTTDLGARPAYLVLSLLLASMLLRPYQIWIIFSLNILGLSLLFVALPGAMLMQPLASQIILGSMALQVVIALVGFIGALSIQRSVTSLAAERNASLAAEEKLRASEERFRLALLAIRAVVYDWDLPNNSVTRSTMVSELFGYPANQVLPLVNWWTERIHPDDRKASTATIQAAIQAREGFTLEYRFLAADGSYHQVLDRGVIVCDTAGQVTRVIGSCEDITEQRQIEARYRQAQKMESVGLLAGGIAHDFNNLLTVISGNIALALDDTPLNNPIRPDLYAVADAATRAATLTRQLLTFARKQTMMPRIVDLNELVLAIDQLLRRLLPENIRLITLPRPSLGFVRADPHQIEQLLVNLVINARDAMPESGTLTIETANVVLDEAYLRSHVGASSGPHVLLAVSDTGKGIPPEVQVRLFEPFFTTKAPGHGTGLGLATCYGIVKQHGGSIWCSSEVGRGTTFQVYLPRVQASTADPLDAPDVTTVRPGSETVLLVEDDATVRKLAVRVLREWQYQVLEAANGSAALALAAQHHGPIELLISDVVMPQLGGQALAAALSARFPHLKVLYISGYSDQMMLDRGEFERGGALLEKPFTPMELVRAVRRILDTNHTTPLQGGRRHNGS